MPLLRKPVEGKHAPKLCGRHASQKVFWMLLQALEFGGCHLLGQVLGSETTVRGTGGPLGAGTKGKDSLMPLVSEIPQSVWGERNPLGWVSDSLWWAQLFVS